MCDARLGGPRPLEAKVAAVDVIERGDGEIGVDAAKGLCEVRHPRGAGEPRPETGRVRYGDLGAERRAPGGVPLVLPHDDERHRRPAQEERAVGIGVAADAGKGMVRPERRVAPASGERRYRVEHPGTVAAGVEEVVAQTGGDDEVAVGEMVFREDGAPGRALVVDVRVRL